MPLLAGRITEQLNCKMNQSTPESDAAWNRFVGKGDATMLYYRMQQMERERDAAREVLKEAEGMLSAHHESSLCTFIGDCPVCSKNHTERYPANIFGRVERVLSPANASAMAPPPQRLPSTKDVPGG